MAVVINEFEIVTEPPMPAGERNQPQAVDTGTPQELTTHDIAALVRHEAERSARYWAH